MEILIILGTILGIFIAFMLVGFAVIYAYYCIKYRSFTGQCVKHTPVTKVIKYYKKPELFEPRTVMLRVQGEVEACSKCDEFLSAPRDVKVLDYIGSFTAPQDTWDEINDKGYKVIKE
jgi:hypothetical protein